MSSFINFMLIKLYAKGVLLIQPTKLDDKP